MTREVCRNASHWGYRYLYADALALQRIPAKAARHRKFAEAMWQWAMERLSQGWLFAAICGRAEKECVPMVCAATFYQVDYRR